MTDIERKKKQIGIEDVYLKLCEIQKMFVSDKPDTSVMRFKAEDERVVINSMKKMRKKGATYDEIAKFLNDNNTPTFSGKGRWYKQTVHRLCS